MSKTFRHTLTSEDREIERVLFAILLKRASITAIVNFHLSPTFPVAEVPRSYPKYLRTSFRQHVRGGVQLYRKPCNVRV
jgi:hypothetical protein